MPEGDTVWRTARLLHQALSGEPLVRSDVRVPQLATLDLTGRTVLETRSRGKHLLTHVQGGLTLHSHLGMDGAWRVYAPDERWRGGPGHHIRIVLATTHRIAVGYRLSTLRLLRTPQEEAEAFGHLGPDLLGADWNLQQALRRLLATPSRPVSEALLDQRNLAGIGNVYASELCFLARVAPSTPIGELSAPDQLLSLAKRLLERNKSHTVRSTTGQLRPDRALYVYGRERRPCLRCGTAIRRGEHGPPAQLRVVYFCPRCQPEPSANP